MCSKWHLQPISQADADLEPLAERLSFERRPPSWATRQALAKADQHAPPIDVDRVRAGQRPRRAS
jgi:hypothetical protein